MNHATAIGKLLDAYPREEFAPRTIALYADRLGGIPAPILTRAIDNLVMRCKWRPTVGEIATECAELALGLPSEEQAWEIACRGSLRDAHPAVQKAAAHVGGRWDILHSENPTAMRAQFRDAYRNLRAEAVDEYRTGRPRPLPDGSPELASPTMAALPESRYAAAPPVHARWLRRVLHGGDLGPPTEEEKSHAIEVLRDGPPTEGDPDPVYIEAERIFMEAGI